MYIPLVGGAVAFLVTLGVLRWAWLGFFASVLGMALAAVIAHALGTAAAMILDLPLPKRNLRTVLWRIGVAAATTPVLWFGFLLLVGTWPRVFYLSGLGLIAAAVIASTLCALVVWPIEPAWSRYAAPLALVAITVTSIWAAMLTSSVANLPGPLPGGPNNQYAAPK